MKKSTFSSLIFKINIVNLLVIVAIMAAIGIIISIKMTTAVTEMSEEKISLLADENARIAADYLNTLEQRTSTLSYAVMSYQSLDPEKSKELTKELFTQVLSDTRIFGAYVALEPDTYYENTSDGYSFYAYRSETGEIVYENYPYDDYKDGEFYVASKESHRPEVTEPYEWTLTNGEVIWLITISTPMLDQDGNFIGVTNCDVSVDTVNSLTFDMGGYETAYSYILTDKGHYVAHSIDKSKYGTDYEKNGSEDLSLDAASNGEYAFFETENQVFDGNAYAVNVPLAISDIEVPWSSAFVVNKSEVLQSVSGIIRTIAVSAVLGLLLLAATLLLYLRKSLSPIKPLVTLASDMNAGKLSSNIQVNTKDELGQLSHIFNNTAATLNGYVREISELLVTISNGDLTEGVRRDYVGDFAPIKAALQRISKSLNSTFIDIDAVAEQVSSGASQLAAGAETLAAAATEQASAMEELASTIQSVNEDVQKNTENVSVASRYISEAGQEVEKSNQYMEDLLTAMSKISESSGKISGIIQIINDISFQTNLLALNAAVEAARAGQAGKGFAVVAEEVRSLASKSAEAASQTSELINTSIAAVNDGLKLADLTASSLTLLEEKAGKVVQSNQKIIAASNSQAQAILEINKGLGQLSMAIQTISATSEENAAASEELSGQAQVLFDHVSRFKTKK